MKIRVISILLWIVAASSFIRAISLVVFNDLTTAAFAVCSAVGLAIIGVIVRDKNEKIFVKDWLSIMLFTVASWFLIVAVEKFNVEFMAGTTSCVIAGLLIWLGIKFRVDVRKMKKIMAGESPISASDVSEKKLATFNREDRVKVSLSKLLDKPDLRSHVAKAIFQVDDMDNKQKRLEFANEKLEDATVASVIESVNTADDELLANMEKFINNAVFYDSQAAPSVRDAYVVNIEELLSQNEKILENIDMCIVETISYVQKKNSGENTELNALIEALKQLQGMV